MVDVTTCSSQKCQDLAPSLVDKSESGYRERGFGPQAAANEAGSETPSKTQSEVKAKVNENDSYKFARPEQLTNGVCGVRRGRWNAEEALQRC